MAPARGVGRGEIAGRMRRVLAMMVHPGLAGDPTHVVPDLGVPVHGPSAMADPVRAGGTSALVPQVGVPGRPATVSRVTAGGMSATLPDHSAIMVRRRMPVVRVTVR